MPNNNSSSTRDNNSANASSSRTQAVNWAGSIPIHLTLAPTSVSSPTLPPPIHVLVPRNTFLHLGLASAIQRLHAFAPVSSGLMFGGSGGLLQISEPDPGVGGDSDGDTANNKTTEAAAKETANDNSTTSLLAQPFSYPVCWLEDEETSMAVRWHLFAGVLYDLTTSSDRSNVLPWKLRLHFTNYPSSQLLPLDAGQVLAAVQSAYKHSLKQAMTVLTGNSKSAMNVTKESHELLWEAVTTANYRLYQRVELVSSKRSDPVCIPVRLLIGSKPPIQRRVDASEAGFSLGSLLSIWLPENFALAVEEESNDDCDGDDAVAPNESVACWRVNGVQPPLTVPILDLWKHCSHPDHFLYIVVLTK